MVIIPQCERKTWSQMWGGDEGNRTHEGGGGKQNEKTEHSCEPSTFGEQFPRAGHRTGDEAHSPCSSKLPPCEVYTWTIHNFNTSVSGLLGGRQELMCAKCLKQCLAGDSMCSIDVIYYYYLAFCIALCCSIVYKALWHFLYKASGLYTFSKYLSRLMSTKFHWVLSVSQVLARLGSEMPKMNQGVCPWSDWRGRLHFHTCLLLRDREELGQEEGQWRGQGFTGGAATSTWGWGWGRLHRCLALEETFWKEQDTLSLCT